MKRWSAILSAISLAAVMMPLGCHNSADDGLPSKDMDKATRYSSIITQSGGDWSKISQADKDYIAATFTNGDAGKAEALVARSKSLRQRGAHPGGPRTPGGPPAPGGG